MPLNITVPYSLQLLKEKKIVFQKRKDNPLIKNIY
jgi:hypothetical protein